MSKGLIDVTSLIVIFGSTELVTSFIWVSVSSYSLLMMTHKYKIKVIIAAPKCSKNPYINLGTTWNTEHLLPVCQLGAINQFISR